jgi:hypothetical protein
MTRGVFLALPLLCCPFPAAANDPGQEAYMIRMPQVPPSAWENRIIAEPPRRQPHGQPLPFVRQDDVARLARLASTRNGPQQRCADSCDHVGYCRRGQPLVSLYSLIALVTAPKYRLSKETGRPTSPLRKKTKENGETCHGYGDDVKHLAGGRT